MFNRPHVAFLVCVACLLLASGAAAAEPKTFTATSSPTQARPGTAVSYTVEVTNVSPLDEADRAKISIPSGFTVDTGTVVASTAAAGTCTAATWVADGMLIADGKINLRRSGSSDNNLCPGETLTVVFSATAAAEGVYSWAPELLRGDDPFTLVGESPTVVVDGTPPNTTIDSAPPALTNQTSASFSFSSSESGSSFQCRLDGAAFGNCPGAPYSGLADGSHTFRVRAIDAAGNIDPTPAAYTWTVDTVPPSTAITSSPPNPTNQTSATFVFSSEAGATFECSLDAIEAGAFAPCTSPKSYAGLPGGARTFQVRATDAAGNTDPTPATHSWRIDLTGPATTIVTAPASATNSTTASFTFQSSEPGATFECSLDTALFTACSPPVVYSLGPGAHTFAVRSLDETQNTGPEASHSWTIDTRPPTATVTSGPSGLSNSRSARFTFAADEPSSFQCQLDGGSLVPCSSPVSYQNLRDGAHTFVARPTDAVGNTGASSSYSWTIDAIAPETTLGRRPRAQTKALSATFTFSASEPATFECRLDGGSFAPCTSPKKHRRLRSSRHRFEVRAVDAAGNIDSSPAVHRWTIGAQPRTLKKSSALLAPTSGARISLPPLLRWRRVARATYYNVQLYRGRMKLLSAWPRRPRLQLRTRFTYLGRQRRLARGSYRWYVWPGYGSPSARRYGRLLGEGSFTLVAPGRR